QQCRRAGRGWSSAASLGDLSQGLNLLILGLVLCGDIFRGDIDADPRPDQRRKRRYDHFNQPIDIAAEIEPPFIVDHKGDDTEDAPDNRADQLSDVFHNFPFQASSFWAARTYFSTVPAPRYVL